jgi:hypothetical protein
VEEKNRHVGQDREVFKITYKKDIERIKKRYIFDRDSNASQRDDLRGITARRKM